ncbi:MAG: NAD(P)/FAD-dependent oxidoreductase [Acidobacteria bacterium]|nr:NAD(P)/FAD-dependent oxidoreductase [Acidobacteriota bacterium]
MDRCDALVVGGGPAGSSSAWRLRRAGLDVVVLDKARFPRDKLCAGWITPPVLDVLEIDPADYAEGRTLQPITGFRTSRLGPRGPGREVETRFGEPVSYGIRRCEFDHYLLERSGARLEVGEPLATLERRGDAWVANDRLAAPVLIGAGGHFCPVARTLNRAPRAEPIVAAQEIEPRLNGAACRIAGDTPELFFCPDLRGYGWCFRKGDYLNVGFGRQDSSGLRSHVRAFFDWLQASGKIPRDVAARWPGHAYLLRGSSPREPVGDGLLLVGDAAGLAYPASGEGIRPAVESGLMAADTLLAADGRYDRARLEPYAKWLTERFGRPVRGRPWHDALPAGVRGAAAGWLLANPWFTRNFLIDRAFLQRQQPPLEPAPGGSPPTPA